jgi:hypothetical protein
MSAYGEGAPVEQVLLEEVRRAERAYREAVALSQAIDSALERYRSAVKDFSDLILYGRQPNGQSESRR